MLRDLPDNLNLVISFRVSLSIKGYLIAKANSFIYLISQFKEPFENVLGTSPW